MRPGRRTTSATVARAPLAADGIACARQAGEPQLEVWGRNLLAGLAWHAGDADQIVAEIEASRALSGQADPALAARAQVLLANAAFLAGDLAEEDRHGLLAIELARTAAGQEGLALALMVSAISAIAGAGIQPATVAALDEAADVTAAHPDRFTETVMHHWRARLFATLGQLDAAETELGLCWAAGRSGAVRLVEFLGPLPRPVSPPPGATPRPPSARSAGPLTAGAASGSSCSFPPPWLTWRAWPPSPVTRPRRPPPWPRRAPSSAAAARRSPPPRSRYAEGVMAWHRGELADAEHLVREATVQWHRGCDRMDACDGIELLGVLAAARERFPDAARLLAAADAARRPLQYLAPGFTANRAAAARRQPGPALLGDDRFTQAWEEGQGLTLDDAVAYAARKGGGRKRPAAGWASLTPAELEVVRLAGEGLRNDAIARRLFIAPGTVKVHLSHIFAKLGITTRAELAAQAAAQDLTAR